MSRGQPATSPKKERRQSVRFAEHPQTIRDEGEAQHFSLFDAEDEGEAGDLGNVGDPKRGQEQGSSKLSLAYAADIAVASGGVGNGYGSGAAANEGEDLGPLGAHANGSALASSRRPAYGLRSTQSSREAEFDADDSDVEEDTLLAMDTSDAVRADGNIDKALRTHGNGNMSPTRTRAIRQNGAINTHSPNSSPTSGRRMSDSSPFAALDRARRSISEGMGGHDLRESLRSAMESEELPDWLRKGAGILDSTWNMSNSILGAGVVGLPYAVKESGCLAGILLILGIALMTDWTIRLIVLNAKLSGRGTYIDIMDYCFGRNGRIAVSIFQGTFAFGGMCAFIVVIGDTLPHVLTSIIPALEGSFLASRGLIMVVSTLTVSFPLSLYRSIESLSRASAIALVSMVLIILSIIIRGPAMPEALKGDPSLRFTIIHPTNVVRSIAVISFAFVCHHNSLLIYGSLREPSMDRFGKVTHYSTAIAATALVAMSLAGYWTFTDKTLGNVLNNFPPDDTIVNIARFCFGMNMLTTWPLELFVAREVIETYYFEGQYDQRRHVIVTVALTLASLIVSLLATDLGIVLEVTGGLSATALAFIFPSICYLRLCDQGQSVGAQNASREEGRNTYRGVPEEENDEDDEDDRQADAELHREVHGDLSVDEVELPLRPGALLRRRGLPGASGKPTPWYLTTKPLAIMCTVFGCFVMAVSLYTTLRTALFGSGEPAVPPQVAVPPGSAAAVAAGQPANATAAASLESTAGSAVPDSGAKEANAAGAASSNAGSGQGSINEARRLLLLGARVADRGDAVERREQRALGRDILQPFVER